MGAFSAVACLFSLTELIKVLIVVQALFQFSAQCIAVELVRRQHPRAADCYRMPLYPLPALIALFGWLYIAVSSGIHYMVIGLGMVAAGFGAYLIKAKRGQEWPFEAL
jgi:hypothetical protein